MPPLLRFRFFFTQNPSFLAFQKSMQQNKGKNNAQALFRVQTIPSDNQIRNLLDPVPPTHLFPIFSASFILRFTPSMEKHGFSSQEVRNLKNNYEQISL